jgi:membrane-associated phospholipid phosphatase
MIRVLLLAFVTLVRAHALDTTATVFDRVWDDVRNLPRGLGSDPVPTVAATSGSVAIIVWLSGSDLAVRSAVQRSHHPTLDALANVGNTLGQGWSGAALTAALLAGGAVMGSEHTVTTGRLLLEALALAGAATTMLKITIGRARPWRNCGDGFLLPFRWDDGQWSLPSGHATIGGTILGVTLGRSESVVVRTSAAALALLIAGARVYSDQHWVSDVILGTSVGALIGLAITRTQQQSSCWYFYPVPNGIGIARAW